MAGRFPKKAVDGGKVQELQRIFGHDFLGVSASINPFGLAFPMDFACANLSIYPDDGYTELKEIISLVFSQNSEEIGLGNGSAELIRVYCHTIHQPDDAARIDLPAFSEYGLSMELTGAEVLSKEQLQSRIPRTCFICNPNNPTGTILPRNVMLFELRRCKAEGTYRFVDAAFMDQSELEDSVACLLVANLFVVRSLTKFFGIPGIQFGFDDPDLIDKIDTARPQRTVNAFVEHYEKLGFAHYHEQCTSTQRIAAEHEWYYALLKDVGLSYECSSVNYILIHPNRYAAAFTSEMMDRGILVCDCTSFGLPDSIQVSVEMREKNVRVLEAIFACLH
ncbi:MAG: histidinol-phosphate aminotransferase family protein [Methanocalculaceae archaeon]|nr:histidinol-phosphate aminotransferase family protein [Methanocalculaceae archaeon]